MSFPPVCPEIPVADLAQSIAYYRDQLGFSIDWSDETIGIAGLSRGETRVFMTDAAYRQSLGNQIPITLWLNLNNREEIDALHREWSDAGAIVDDPPAAQPHKLYEFFAEDPDGNVWRVFYDFAWEERVPE